jgi:hypothetical protein
MSGKKVAFEILVLPLVLSALACSASVTPTVAPGFEHIARVHQSRCGACHTPVEPGQRSRAELASALARHGKRVRLTQGEWAQMIDYLAARENASLGAPRAD